MRVWDVSPGYLNRQSLLGEHREIHGMISIIANHKQGYSHHPETVRWKGHLWALRRRHDWLVSEMELRGYTHLTPTPHRGAPGLWPPDFVDEPRRQFAILKGKYVDKEPGRIPLPRSARELRVQHEHSVLAREGRAGDIGSLVALLRRPPTPRGLKEALARMWEDAFGKRAPTRAPGSLYRELRRRGLEALRDSVALSELGLWLRYSP